MMMRLLGVLLCYNDGDLLEDLVRYLLEQNHDVIVWDHGSTDRTAEVIQSFRSDLIETRCLPREFDFYELYPAMSRHLLENYVAGYDWISWPDQDEFLEGPSRLVPYSDSLAEVFESPCNWIQFDNFNFWFTSADDVGVKSAPARIRHYALFPDCAPRIRSWRSSATNIRVFNHNPPLGEPWPIHFRLRHYPMRSREQMLARLVRDRAGMLRDGNNYHYENMKLRLERLEIQPAQLHYDDGHAELNLQPVFDWRSIYGHEPPSGLKSRDQDQIMTTSSKSDDSPNLKPQDFVSPASFWIPERFVVSAWVEHAPFAFWLIDALRPRILVELGTHTGYSYLAFAQAVKRLDLSTRCFAIDTWKGDEHAGSYGEEVFTSLRDYHDRHYSSFSQLERTTFDDAAKYFEDGSVDLLHIDGRHFYGDVKHDFETWKVKLSDRAVVLLHDISVRRRQFGVCWLWNELRKQYPHFEFVHCQGLGVAGVGSSQAKPLKALFAASNDPQLALQVREMYGRLGTSLNEVARRQGEMSAANPLATALAVPTGEINRLPEELAHGSSERDQGQAELSLPNTQYQELNREISQREREREQLLTELSRLAAEQEQSRTELRRLGVEARAREQELRHITSSLSWRISRPVRVVGSLLPPELKRRCRRMIHLAWWSVRGQLPARLRQRQRVRRDSQVVLASGMFDKDWYLQQNPDVASSGVDPLEHYILFGGLEGRNPGPAFQSSWYLAQNSDVADSGMNPLVHYVTYGKSEGRLPCASFPTDGTPFAAPSAVPKSLQPRNRRLKVVFVSGNPQAVGHRYRVLNLAESLPLGLCEPVIIPIDDLPQRLTELDDNQITWIWRVPWSETIAHLVESNRKRRVPVVFDIDDLLFRPELATTEIIDGIRYMGTTELGMRSLCERFRRTLSEADHFTTTTAPLAREALALCKPATIIPNGYEQERLDLSRAACRDRDARARDGLVRIGYCSGTPTHQRDLAVASRALAAVLTEFPHARLVLWRSGVNLDEFPELQAHMGQIEWRERVGRDETPREYARFDINLAPLEAGNPFCEAKSELKFFEAALVGVPTVASPTQPYAQAIRHGETGFLASDHRQWCICLRDLVQSGELRKRIGDRAYQEVLWPYGPEQRRLLLTRFIGLLLDQLRGDQPPVESGSES
ncbi:MAG TPA: class I SAM-dependent methyltransferase [Terriglobales bacterium]|jgi:glycosyltransferase involved in cell wall biosynthesis